MSGIQLAKRYARALLESFDETGSISDLLKDIALMEQIFREVPEIRAYCLRSHTNVKDEMEFIRNVFIPYVNEITGRLLQTAASNGRLALIPFLPAAVRDWMEKKGDSISVIMETAHDYDKEILTLAQTKMEKKTGKDVHLQLRLRPELLGGLRLIWQNRMLDMSIVGRINQIRRILRQDEL